MEKKVALCYSVAGGNIFQEGFAAQVLCYSVAGYEIVK